MQLSYPLQLRTKASLDLEQLQFSVLSSWMKYLIWRQQAPGIKYICWQISHWTQSFIWYQWRLLRHRTKRIPTSNFNQICQRRGKLVQPSSTPPHQRPNSQVMTYKTQTCSMPVLLIFLVVNSGMIMRQERARSLTKCYQELCLINLEHMIPASVSCVTPQFIKQTLKAVTEQSEETHVFTQIWHIAAILGVECWESFFLSETILIWEECLCVLRIVKFAKFRQSCVRFIFAGNEQSPATQLYHIKDKLDIKSQIVCDPPLVSIFSANTK